MGRAEVATDDVDAGRRAGRARRWFRRLRRTIASLVLVYAFAFVVGPFVYVSVAGVSCTDWAVRPVADLDATWQDAVVAVADSRVVSVGWLPAGFSAAVLPGTTLLATDAGVRVVFHEAAHHIQIDQDGVVGYLARYSVDWARGMYHGCGPYDAYRGVGYEIQARLFSYRYGAVFGRTLDDVVGGVEFVGALADLHAAGVLEPLVARSDRPAVTAAVVELAGTPTEVGWFRAVTGDAARPSFAVTPYGAQPAMRSGE